MASSHENGNCVIVSVYFGGEFVYVALALGLLVWGLIFGSFFLLWWLPGHLELRALKRRSLVPSKRSSVESEFPIHTSRTGGA